MNWEVIRDIELNIIFERLKSIYNSIGEGKVLPEGLTQLMVDIAGETYRLDELKAFDKDHQVPDFDKTPKQLLPR
jgi:hypothetical protein